MSRIVPSSTVFPDYYLVRNTHGQIVFGTPSNRRPCRTCGGATHHELRTQWSVGQCKCPRMAVPSRLYRKRHKRMVGK